MSSRTMSVAATSAFDRGAEELVTAVLMASRVLVGVSARSIAGLEDTVTLAQFRCLVVLDSHPKINLNALAELLSVTPSTAMRMINRLLAMGLVTRRDNPGNRREVLLGVSEEGQGLVQTVTARRRAEIADIVARMPQARRDELVIALRAFAEAAHEPEPHPEGGTTLGW
ncbi:MAG: MarR family winged helix-turn-helix transcriptional regulator [Rhodoglobus sp.]